MSQWYVQTANNFEVLRIVVHKVTGDIAELDLDARSNGLDVKICLAELWGVPPVCQQLVAGTEVLY
jgi:hypothetical protein